MCRVFTQRVTYCRVTLYKILAICSYPRSLHWVVFLCMSSSLVPRLSTCALINNWKERGKRPSNYLLFTLYVTHGINYSRPLPPSKLQAMSVNNKPSHIPLFWELFIVIGSHPENMIGLCNRRGRREGNWGEGERRQLRRGEKRENIDKRWIFLNFQASFSYMHM